MTDTTEEQPKRGRPSIRELETRELSERPKAWVPASVLPDPIKERGYTYRWVRVAARNEADPLNISAKTREGWEPVRREEQPHLARISDRNSYYEDAIEIAGLMLCKMPNELVAQRNAYFDNKAKSQMEAVDNDLMRLNDPRMPLFKERRSTVSRGFGNGR